MNNIATAPSEPDLTLDEWRSCRSDQQQIPQTLKEGLVRSRRCFSDATALHVEGRDYTYRRLLDDAAGWADILSSRPRRKDGEALRVGIFSHRSYSTYLGTAAAVVANATFVPLNPKLPAARLRFICESADLDAIFVDPNCGSLLGEVLKVSPLDSAILWHGPKIYLPKEVLGYNVFSIEDVSVKNFMVDINGGGIAPDDAAPDDAAPDDAAPDDVAYIMFTSGSSGQPKGVPIRNRNVAPFIASCVSRYKITAQDRLSQTFDHSFDLWVFDIFVSWFSGAGVYVPQPIELLAPAQFVRRHEITVWFTVPSLAQMVVRSGRLRKNSMPTLRLCLFCGEALLATTASAWQDAAPKATLENLYGPTEATIWCLAYTWDSAKSPEECLYGIVPIGLPISSVDSRIVDGELCITGPQIFAGYLNAPEKTAEAFLFCDRRYYLTGDLVDRSPRGNYRYIGRRDSQIKRQGYRIELAEIELALRKAGCTDAVVIFPTMGEEGRLVAFVISQIPEDHLKEALRLVLPTYMVPKRIFAVTGYPLNMNGKVDRGLLIEQFLREDHQ